MNPLINRPKISVYIATSIDGYIARENGGLDWLDRTSTNPDEDYGFKAFMSSVDILIMGRNTYDIVSSFDKWPYKEKRVVIISKKLEKVRAEVELFSGDLHELVSRLHAEKIKHIYVDGGITICKFLEMGLIDQIILTVVPTILGNGIRLFTPMKRGHNFHLTSTKSYPNGLVQLRYTLQEDSQLDKV